MEFARQLPPPKIDRKVRVFCERISPGITPSYVPVRTDLGSKLWECFGNVEERVKRHGGEIVYGWEISELPRIALEARFHAVWLATNGALLDITPEEFSQPQILFLRDAVRKYAGTRVENQRFPLGDKNLVDEYFALADATSERLRAMSMSGFKRGHPVLRQELGPSFLRMQQLKQRIQNGDRRS